MKPKPHTIQWIAPHLSEGEVQAIYEMVLRDAIGDDEAIPYYNMDDQYLGETRNTGRDADVQRAALSTLFGRGNK